MMSLMEAALATGGTALGGNPRLEGVSTDSRTMASGELFIALRGENFDGHEFVEAAAARGAAAAMVEAAWAEGRSLACRRWRWPTRAWRSAPSAPGGAPASRCRWSASPAATARPR
jgi:hypothetical protein